MKAEPSQLHYTCIFLQVSFQAIQHSLDSAPGGESSPCWLDAQLIKMLMGEIERCRSEVSHREDIALALDSALYHVGLLLAQCPGGLTRRLCRRHLEAIIAPLKSAAERLAAPRPVANAHRRFSARRLLRGLNRR